MKKKIQIARTLLAFLPNLLSPTKLYMSGDDSILSITTATGHKEEYSISKSNTGHNIELKDHADNRFFIYVNRNRTPFLEKVLPTIDGRARESYKFVSLGDEKLLAIMHEILTNEMQNRRFKVKDTYKILECLDQAIQYRTGMEQNRKWSHEKWESMKAIIEEAKIVNELNIVEFKSSGSPMKTSALTSQALDINKVNTD